MRVVMLLMLGFVAGCGPMTQPMVHRLCPEQQEMADEVWENVLTPPGRLDHELLLDVILAYQMYQTGIDRLRLTSEKQAKDGVVIMEVYFDREHPAMDEFTIRYVNHTGRELRRERYSREEVEDRFGFLHQCNADAVPIPDEDEEAWCARRQAEHEARLKQIAAATQPASLPPSPER